MEDFDFTRLGDHALAEAYFDRLSDVGPDDEYVETMKTELEERDLLFKGYLIKDWTSGYTVEGCVRIFRVLEDLKDYILGHNGIEPVYDGSMHYNTYSTEELALRAGDRKINPEPGAKIVVKGEDMIIALDRKT